MLVLYTAKTRRLTIQRERMPKSTIRILRLDIETAPSKVYTFSLFPKYISHEHMIDPGYVLCWAAQWEGERTMHYMGLNTHTKEEMMKGMWDLVDEADAVIHYNGTKFDMKVLNREFLLQGLPPPSHYVNIDLYRTVTRNFAFESKRLDYVCKRLGLGTKVKHQGMQLWIDCMKGKEAAWKKMERYNRRDVKLLKTLYDHLQPWIKPHPNRVLWIEDPKKPTCPVCASTDVVKKGTQHNTNTQSYDRYRCNKCQSPLRSRRISKTTSDNVLLRG